MSLTRQMVKEAIQETRSTAPPSPPPLIHSDQEAYASEDISKDESRHSSENEDDRVSIMAREEHIRALDNDLPAQSAYTPSQPNTPQEQDNRSLPEDLVEVISDKERRKILLLNAAEKMGISQVKQVEACAMGLDLPSTSITTSQPVAKFPWSKATGKLVSQHSQLLKGEGPLAAAK